METHIYAIKNVINNKMYIGSSKNVKKRKWEHFYQLKNNKHHSEHFQKSYNKYGKDKFFFYILENCNSDIRKDREIYYINKYRSNEREFGYNINEPNENNFSLSIETKIKISNKKSNKIPIDVYTLDGTFIKSYECIYHCELELKTSPGVINQILKNKRKSYKGYTFVKKGDKFNYIPSSKQRNMEKFYKKQIAI